jgi:hypothetical protein
VYHQLTLARVALQIKQAEPKIQFPRCQSGETVQLPHRCAEGDAHMTPSTEGLKGGNGVLRSRVLRHLLVSCYSESRGSTFARTMEQLALQGHREQDRSRIILIETSTYGRYEHGRYSTVRISVDGNFTSSAWPERLAHRLTAMLDHTRLGSEKTV